MLFRSRLGVVVATVVTMQVALNAFARPAAGGLIAARPGEMSGTVRELVLRIGLPSMRDLTAGMSDVAVRRAFDAIVDGMRMTELIVGVVAIAVGVVVIAAGTPVIHDGRWGLATQEVAVAILESARTRKEVFLRHQVPLPDREV